MPHFGAAVLFFSRSQAYGLPQNVAETSIYYDKDALAFFSGTGPTSDGRIKPDLVAPGHAIRSALAGSACSQQQLSGTSMATPTLAGLALLTQQYFRVSLEGIRWLPCSCPLLQDGFYPTGAAVSANGFTSPAHLVGPLAQRSCAANLRRSKLFWSRVQSAWRARRCHRHRWTLFRIQW